ncbi:hypothetical protein [Bacteroides helcogenes]|uniref:PKD domain-containing protein n=1 Tax=Bacteroides helcogenes (strain ATCC 35417 / DSM 20613 / JCM 6297 / CCUG 15421 / P 36-108) TaxID=693979 RepID=E6SPJ7_BACT6|nr:hypothetical protein [Bacteroides helcogenes]ADV42886.1 hypothetical protein Bache_0869 [Bacteroides helcogenes P 36-108]MDY5237069.1 hypothetical protein [Bacteroides helcogenes]
MLKENVPLTIAEDGSYSIPSDKINLAGLESGATYTLIIASNMEDKNTADVSFSFDAMQFKVKTTAASTQFTMPIATGATSAIAILWGDTDGKDDKEILTVDATNRAKTYATAGTYTVRLLAAQTDRTQKQIPEFNFGKYPTVTWDGNNTYNRNTNAEMLVSVDSPLLNSDATDLGGVFYGTANLSSIHEDAFRYYPNATSFYDAFYTVNTALNNSMTAIPAKLFAYNTKVTNFCETFGNLRALVSVPEDLFANCQNATDMSYTFYSCKALTTVPANLFANNKSITTFRNLFGSCSALNNVPAALFANNTEVTTFVLTFRSCTSLKSVPKGLFANNKKAFNFCNTFHGCNSLVDFEYVFINNDSEKATRFASLDKPIDVNNMLSGVGSSSTSGAANYNAIDFSSYTYSANGGFTWDKDQAPYVNAATTFKNYSTVSKYYGGYVTSCAAKGAVAYPNGYGWDAI